MSEKQVNDLSKVYNTLLLISTRGDDTMIMAECIKALRQIIEEGAQQAGLAVQSGQNPESVISPDEEKTEE